MILLDDHKLLEDNDDEEAFASFIFEKGGAEIYASDDSDGCIIGVSTSSTFNLTMYTHKDVIKTYSGETYPKPMTLALEFYHR